MVKRLLLFLCLLPCHMATAAMTPGPYRCTAESGQVFLLLEKGEDGWRGTVGENRLVDAVLRQVPGGPPGTATFAMAGNNIPGRATLSLREAVPTPSATPGISNSAAVSPSAGVSGSAPSPPVAAAVTPPRPTGLTGQATVFHKDGSLDETFQVACAPLAGDIREALDPATSFRLCQAALRDITQAIGAAYAKDGTVFTDMPSRHAGPGNAVERPTELPGLEPGRPPRQATAGLSAEDHALAPVAHRLHPHHDHRQHRTVVFRRLPEGRTLTKRLTPARKAAPRCAGPGGGCRNPPA